jgi:hypothetical protein
LVPNCQAYFSRLTRSAEFILPMTAAAIFVSQLGAFCAPPRLFATGIVYIWSVYRQANRGAKATLSVRLPS